MRYFLSMIAFLAILTSCQEATKYRDVILFTGTEDSPVIKFTVDDMNTTMALTVTATDKVTEDTQVGMSIANDMLASYNESNSRSYVALPAANYEIDKTVTVIKSGFNVSEQILIHIKSLDGLDEGKIYCIPVTITSVSTGIEILETSRTAYIVLNRPIVSNVMNLNGAAFNVPKFQTDERVSALQALTMEARVKSSAWSNANPFISTVMGVEENYLLRFGDISLNRGDLLQMGPAKVGDKKFFVTGNTAYALDKWYHIASVYDGSSVAIYVDGKLDKKISVDPSTVNLNDDYFDGFWIGKSERGRIFQGAISEVRVWNRALSASELQDNACIVDPKSKGLLAYWKFNTIQEDGKTVRDETGNGFDAIANSNRFTWVEKVKCPE